ncbi:MAG: hypothetical protein ERJ67_00720 [Aphanocapsa feldmannii 277cV]|uniref:Tetratricopeptide repeat protein n=1 Tax=Aphanocapsa feldmannii 277cV TaxID=2507553 RepID=A0A524RR20_9CHRO|nr:MAG: hypothetical protein ERJ67_00720 [Aphanocapsa feldmannii 277cV]
MRPNRSDCLRNLGNPAISAPDHLRICDKVVEDNPRSLALHLDRFRVRQQLGREEEGCADLQRLVDHLGTLHSQPRDLEDLRFYLDRRCPALLNHQEGRRPRDSKPRWFGTSEMTWKIINQEAEKERMRRSGGEESALDAAYDEQTGEKCVGL